MTRRQFLGFVTTSIALMPAAIHLQAEEAIIDIVNRYFPAKKKNVAMSYSQISQIMNEIYSQKLIELFPPKRQLTKLIR